MVVRSLTELRGESAYLAFQSSGFALIDSRTATEYSIFIRQEVPSHTKITSSIEHNLKKTKRASNPGHPPKLVK